ncbi:MAG: carboxypeptidase-like regulatory domain-containing protein [Chloroflexota bacterium]
MKNNYIIVLFLTILLACSPSRSASVPGAAPTNTPLPTFTYTPTITPPPPATITLTPTIPINTPTPTSNPPTATVVPSPTPVSTSIPAPTATHLPPTSTPIPLPSDTPTITPTPEPLIKYVLAATQREFNCDFTYIYGTVKNANNFGIPEVKVRALGIHNSIGLDFTTQTDSDGNFEIFRIPFNELLAAEWAIMLTEEGREVSERFHWGSTPACQSDDLGNSQVLRIDWKLIE